MNIRALSQRFLTGVALLVASFVAVASGEIIDKFFATVPGHNDFSGVVTQPDGKFVAVGYARFDGKRQLVAARYVARGAFNTSDPTDASFGNQGVATAAFSADAGTWWRAVRQPDGKIVAAGTAASMALARFNADGSLDTSFGSGGTVEVTQPGIGGAQTLALAPGGQIYVGGYSTGGNPAMIVARFNADGSIDSSYGTGGFATAAVDPSTNPSRGNYLHSLLVLPDGRLLFGGELAQPHAGARFGRLLQTGAFDPAFNGGAVLDVPNFWGAWEMARQSSGLVVVAGATRVPSGVAAMAALRLDIDGHVDASFGSGGIAAVQGSNQVNDLVSSAMGLVVQSTDRIVLYGTQSQGIYGTRGFAARLLTTGAEDSSFYFGVTGNHYVGTDGSAIARFGDDSLAVVGRYAAQSFGNPNAYKDVDGAVDKLTADGGYDYNFNYTPSDGGMPYTADLGWARAHVTGAARESDGHFVVVGEVLEDAVGPFSARFNPDGTQDKSATYRWSPSYHLNAVAIDASGQAVYAGSFRDVGAPTRAWIQRNASVATLYAVFPTATDSALQSVTIQRDGKILGAGWIQGSSGKDSFFARVRGDGPIDSTFGNNGQAVVNVSGGDDVINQVVVQADDRIVGAGWGKNGSQDGVAIVRLNASGFPDSSFAGTGYQLFIVGTASTRANAVAVQPDGKIVAGGTASGANDDMLLLRAQANGGFDGTFHSTGYATADFDGHDRIRSLAVRANGKILAAGETGGNFAVTQWLPNGFLDTAFGKGGLATASMSPNSDASAATLIVTPDGTLNLVGDGAGRLALARLAGDASTGPSLPSTVSLASSKNPSNAGETVNLSASVSGTGGTPTGTVAFLDNGTPIPQCGSVSMSGGSAFCTVSTLSVGTHPIVAQYSGDATYMPASSGVVNQVVNGSSSGAVASLSPTSMDFGRVSMGTTSVFPRDVTLTNTGAATLNISSISVSGPFTQTNNCPAALPSGSSCTIGVIFAPAPAAGPVNEELPVSGTLTVQSDASNGTATTSLAGTAVKSLIDHFYRWILHRAPDEQGRNYWRQQAEDAIARGQNVNEVWYQMAEFIFGSHEYALINDTPQDFVRDLYRTFFNRQADPQGENYWNVQIQHGMPERGAMVYFMFSPEFQQFTQSVFGNTQVRAEVDMVGDFYRGLLGRMPDDSGFTYWVGQFRSAQCQGGAAVSNAAESISSQFVASAEYANRNTTNVVFVADLYDAFMRRGPEQGGLDYWVGELQSGRQNRDQVRHAFEQSQEFQARVNAVAGQGCAS